MTVTDNHKHQILEVLDNMEKNRNADRSRDLSPVERIGWAVLYLLNKEAAEEAAEESLVEVESVVSPPQDTAEEKRMGTPSIITGAPQPVGQYIEVATQQLSQGHLAITVNGRAGLHSLYVEDGQTHLVLKVQ